MTTQQPCTFGKIVALVPVGALFVAHLGCENVVTAIPDGGTTPSGGAACVAPLSANDWWLVRQSVQNAIYDALEVAEGPTENVSPRMTWGNLSVLGGANASSQGLGVGIGDCADGDGTTRPMTCKDAPAGAAARFCMQITCTEKKFDIATAMTDPSVQTTGSTHRLQYDIQVVAPKLDAKGPVASGNGERRSVVYAQNPSVVWHLDRRSDPMKIAATVDVSVTTTSNGADPLDLSMAGNLALTKPLSGDAPTEFSGDLRFAAIKGGALEAHWALDDTRAIVGTVSRAGRAVATFTIPVATASKVSSADWASACQ